MFDPDSARTQRPRQHFARNHEVNSGSSSEAGLKPSGPVEMISQAIAPDGGYQFHTAQCQANITMFDIESMPDLLKPCGIVYSKNCFDPQNRPDENYQLIQDILVSKSSDFFPKSDSLAFSHEGLFEANASVIPVENVTPVTPPFTIETLVTDQYYPTYTNLQKVK